MTTARAHERSTARTPGPDGTASTAPDWSLVPFDVACARCGTNLRGLVDPVCPKCSLRFDWKDAVPIEHLTCAHCGYHLLGLTRPRCPECGREFTWTERLVAHYRTRLRYFEYRWRDRPVRSLFWTWWRALRPRRFWSTFNLHDPPQPRPLFAMVFIGLVLAWVMLGIGSAFISAASSMYRMGMVSSTGSLAAASKAFVMVVSSFFSSARAWEVLVIYGLWLILSLGALFVYQQSMRRFCIRPRQVVRAWANSVALLLPGLTLVTCAFVGVILAFSVRRFGVPSADLTMVVMWLIVLAHSIWSLRCAYKLYFRVPHPLAVAVSSQVIALLGTLVLADVVVVRGFAGALIYQIGRSLSVW